MRIGYLDCFAGISGDMLLGALVDAGVPLATLTAAVDALQVGARLEARRVTRGGMTGTKVDVLLEDGTPAEHGHGHGHSHAHEHHEQGEAHAHGHEHGHADKHAPGHEHGHAHEHTHRSLTTILGIIDAAALPEAVKARASRAFRLLGEAEAAIHGVPVETVHFHEVGAVDTIVDIVATAAGCAALGVERWVCSALNVGSGTVVCAHGILPVPAPATLKLLADAPVYAAGPAMERVTPTGAAILRMLEVEFGSLPAMRVGATGYGAGGRDVPGQPNLLRLVVGEPAEESGEGKIAVMEAVIDDASPQLLAYVSERLLEAGAWDAYRVPVQMKKGRAGTVLTVLCRPELVPALRELVFRETTTIGLHWRVEEKAALEREFVEVATEWGAVRMKVARLAGGEVANAAPEYEDCRARAREHGVALKRVMQAALAAWAKGPR